MSINNVSQISDALKYVNGVSTTTEKTSITDSIKGVVTDPSSLIFAGMSAKDGILKTADTLTISGGSAVPAVITNAANATAEVAGTTAKTGIIGKIKNVFSNLKGAITTISKSGGTGSKSFVENLKSFVSESKATAAASSGTKSASSGIFSKIGSLFSKVTSKVGEKLGGTVIGKAASKVAGSSLGSLVKTTGAGFQMILNGAISLFTEVVPAFQQGGIKSGIKQIAKSAVNVVGGGLGWAGGSAVGAALGATIGSFIGPVGTVVGKYAGQFIGGLVGSAVAGGVASKITGKSEVEKLQDEQYDTTAAQIATDSASMQELQATVSAKVQEDIANGNITEDTEKMISYLNDGTFASATGYNTTGYNTTGYNTNTTSTSTNNIASQSAYLNQVAQALSQGDTSAFNISDEKVSSLFTEPKNSTNSVYSTNNMYTTQEQINYFG